MRRELNTALLFLGWLAFQVTEGENTEKKSQKLKSGLIFFFSSRTYGETDGVDAWVIAVGNIAGLAVIIIAIVVCCCACRRRNQQQG